MRVPRRGTRRANLSSSRLNGTERANRRWPCEKISSSRRSTIASSCPSASIAFKLENYYQLFNGIINPKQLEGLRLLVTPFPQQQFNQTEDRRSEQPSRGVPVSLRTGGLHRFRRKVAGPGLTTRDASDGPHPQTRVGFPAFRRVDRGGLLRLAGGRRAAAASSTPRRPPC